MKITMLPLSGSAVQYSNTHWLADIWQSLHEVLCGVSLQKREGCKGSIMWLWQVVAFKLRTYTTHMAGTMCDDTPNTWQEHVCIHQVLVLHDVKVKTSFTHTHVGHRWTEKGLIACRQCRSSTHVHGRVESCTLLQGHTCPLVPTQTSSSRSWLCTTSGTWLCATPQSRRCTCVSTVCT